MSKKKRIALLERKVAALEAQLAVLPLQLTPPQFPYQIYDPYQPWTTPGPWTPNTWSSGGTSSPVADRECWNA